MGKIDNIKTLWGNMTSGTKTEAVKVLKEEFYLKSESSIRSNWIYRGEIPDEKQDKVVDIFQKILRKQHDSTGKLI